MIDKRCPDCGETKLATEFYRETRRSDGLASYCKPCKDRRKNARNRERYRTDPVFRAKSIAATLRSYKKMDPERKRAAWRRHNAKRTPEQTRRASLHAYGLTPEGYDALLAEQGGACAICGGGLDRARRLAVDHDHATGAVRGLLCSHCNTGLGGFRDDPALLRAALSYIGLVRP